MVMLHELTLYWSQASASNYAWLPEGRHSQPTDTLARITSCCSKLIREWVQKGSFGRFCVQVCGEAEQTHFQVTWLAFFVTPLFQITPAAWLQPCLSSLSCLVHNCSWLSSALALYRGNHKPDNKFQSFRLFVPLGLSDVCMTRGNI